MRVVAKVGVRVVLLIYVHKKLFNHHFRFEVDDTDDDRLKIDGSYFSGLTKQIIKPKSLTDYPTKLSSALVTWSITIYTIIAFMLALVINFMDVAKWYTIVVLVVIVVVLVGILLMISRQPRSSKELAFTVPLVPWLPALSILINVYLMTQLDVMTWVRFLVWIVVGLLIYFCYGVFNSKLRLSKRISQSTATVATTDASR